MVAAPLPERRILAVDVCGTLFRANTTLGFVRHHHARTGNRRALRAIDAMTDRRLPLRYALGALHRLAGIDGGRALLLRSLRGETREALAASAAAYLRDLWPLRNDRVLAHVEALRAEGWEPILVSNSLDVVVEAIAGELGLPFLASALAFRDGRCAGRLDRDLTGGKLAALERHLGTVLDGPALAVVTDNRSDGDLLARASRPAIVAAGRISPWMRQYDATFLDAA